MTNKDIPFHLYLGQQVFCPWDGKSREFRYANAETLLGSNVGEIKLILRRLRDMTEEEALHFAWMCMDSRHHLEKDSRITEDDIQIEFVQNDGGNLLDEDVEIFIGVSCICFDGEISIWKDGSIVLKEEDGGQQHPINDIAEKVLYLISRGFWLFGEEAFENGLVIDKEKIG